MKRFSMGMMLSSLLVIQIGCGEEAPPVTTPAAEVSEAATDVMDATKEAATDAIDATKEAATDAIDATKDAATDAVDAAKEIAP